MELKHQLIINSGRSTYRTVYQIRNEHGERMGDIKLDGLMLTVQWLIGKTWVLLTSMPSKPKGELA